MDWKKYTGGGGLAMESNASVLTFYMYRAQTAGTTPPSNANAASIGGIMWYLHTDIAYCKTCSNIRPYGIDRIARYKVQTKATQPLRLAGMNFGLTLSFEDGKCESLVDCDDTFAKYGYFVGCNSLSSGYPYPNYPVYYTGALYSLPGGCTAYEKDWKSLECRHDQPGGLCQGVPTGNGTCTWSYTEAGTVTLDELVGITNYTAFKESGGEEYDNSSDTGVHMTFWDGLHNLEANAARVKKLDALFKEKFPDMPSDKELPTPPCDFKQREFLSKFA